MSTNPDFAFADGIQSALGAEATMLRHALDNEHGENMAVRQSTILALGLVMAAGAIVRSVAVALGEEEARKS